MLATLPTACGNREDDNVSFNVTPEPTQVMTLQPEKQPATGGTLVLTMRNPKTLNPLLNEDETVDIILSLLFEKLFIMDGYQKPPEDPQALINEPAPEPV